MGVEDFTREMAESHEAASSILPVMGTPEMFWALCSLLSARCLWLHGIYYLGNIFKVFLNNSYSLSSNSKNKQINQYLETVKWRTIASLWGKKNKLWKVFVSGKLFSVQQFRNHHSRVQWHLMTTLCLLYSWVVVFFPMIVGNKQTYFLQHFLCLLSTLQRSTSSAELIWIRISSAFSSCLIT